MKRKPMKSLPWRRFGYVILIIIKFGEVLLWFSPRIINALRSYIKDSKECFIRYPNTSKLVKKTRLRLVFSIHFLVFGYLMKHSSSCLIYYLKNSRDCRCNFELIVFSVINAGLPVVAVVLYILIAQLGFNWPFTVAYADVHNNGDM